MKRKEWRRRRITRGGEGERDVQTEREDGRKWGKEGEERWKEKGNKK